MRLTTLLNSKEIVIEHSDEAQKANELYLKGESQDFADAFLGLIALKNGCSETVTFDKRAARLDFFKELR